MSLFNRKWGTFAHSFSLCYQLASYAVLSRLISFYNQLLQLCTARTVFPILVTVQLYTVMAELSLVDQWKAEKNWSSRNWPITRCFLKPVKAWTKIGLINQHWRAVQYNHGRCLYKKIWVKFYGENMLQFGTQLFLRVSPKRQMVDNLVMYNTLSTDR